MPGAADREESDGPASETDPGASDDGIQIGAGDGAAPDGRATVGEETADTGTGGKTSVGWGTGAGGTG